MLYSSRTVHSKVWNNFIHIISTKQAWLFTSGDPLSAEQQKKWWLYHDGDLAPGTENLSHFENGWYLSNDRLVLVKIFIPRELHLKWHDQNKTTFNYLYETTWTCWEWFYLLLFFKVDNCICIKRPGHYREALP